MFLQAEMTDLCTPRDRKAEHHIREKRLGNRNLVYLSFDSVKFELYAINFNWTNNYLIRYLRL